MKTNEDRVVMIAVQGRVAHPCVSRGGIHTTDRDGLPSLVPRTGGITYNVKVGDPAFGWAGDHIEPGVSALVDEEKRHSPVNSGFNFYACAGNEAMIVSEDAKGATGVVIGHHGGAEHVIIDFPDDVLQRMSLDTKILIKGYGQGLALTDHPNIHLYNLDPGLLARMGVSDNGSTIEVPVAHVVPGKLMGSGVGHIAMGSGDYDIMSTDMALIRELGLDQLRFGDLVAITDHDNNFGRSYRRGAVSIGIVIHSDSFIAGHGPGVTTLMSSSTPEIVPVVHSGANIADILQIGRCRP